MDEANNGKSFAENFGNSVRKRARDEEGIEAQVKELKEKLAVCDLWTCDTCGLVIRGKPSEGQIVCGCEDLSFCRRLICCGLFGCRAEWERVRLCSACGCYLSSKCPSAQRCGETREDPPNDCGKIFCDRCRVNKPGCAICQDCYDGERLPYCLKHVKSVEFEDGTKDFGCKDCIHNWTGDVWHEHLASPPVSVNWKPVVPSAMHALTLQVQKAALAHIAAKTRATLHLNHLQSVEAQLIEDELIQKCPHCEAYLTDGLCRRCRWIDFD